MKCIICKTAIKGNVFNHFWNVHKYGYDYVYRNFKDLELTKEKEREQKE